MGQELRHESVVAEVQQMQEQEASAVACGSPEVLLDGARYDDEEDVRAAISEGTDPNCTDCQGRTPLHMAAANGHAGVVDLLLSFGAAANARNLDLNTPLHYAALNGHVQVVEHLMARDADPCALNRFDRTPMDEAIGKGYNEVMEAMNAAMLSRQANQMSMSGQNNGGHGTKDSAKEIPSSHDTL